MKRNRITYFSLLFASFVFIYFYGGKLPYGVFYLTLLLPVVSIAYTFLIYWRFKYVQNIDKHQVLKGDDLSFHFSVHNEDFLFYPYIKIIFWGSDSIFKDQITERCFSLPPFAKRHFEIDIQCKYRGSYSVGIQTIEFEDFLGIFKLKFNTNDNNHVIVSPRIIPLNAFPLKTDYVSESHSVLNSRQQDMSNVVGIRKYVAGDSLKIMHWKMTAKTGGLKVKEFQSTSETSTVMILDLEKNHYRPDHNIIIEDKLIETAVSMLHYCLHNWIPVNLLFYNNNMLYKQEANNPLMFHELYQILSTVKFEGQIKVGDIIELYLDKIHKTNIMVFTSNLNYDLYNNLHKAHFSGFNITVVYFSPEDITGIQNPEAENILVFLPEIGIEAYKIRIEDDIKAVFGNTSLYA